jgi:hypothetical protein
MNTPHESLPESADEIHPLITLCLEAEMNLRDQEKRDSWTCSNKRERIRLSSLYVSKKPALEILSKPSLKQHKQILKDPFFGRKLHSKRVSKMSEAKEMTSFVSEE